MWRVMRGAVGQGGGMVRGRGVAGGGALGVHGGALVLDVGDEAALVVRPDFIHILFFKTFYFLNHIFL